MQPQQWCCVCLRSEGVKHRAAVVEKNASNNPPPANTGGGCYGLQIVVAVGLFSDTAG